jgi:hypothetical protein
MRSLSNSSQGLVDAARREINSAFQKGTDLPETLGGSPALVESPFYDPAHGCGWG